MDTVSRTRRWPWIAGVAILLAAIAGWWYFGTSRNQEAKGASRASTTLVVTTRSESRDVLRGDRPEPLHPAHFSRRALRRHWKAAAGQGPNGECRWGTAGRRSSPSGLFR